MSRYVLVLLLTASCLRGIAAAQTAPPSAPVPQTAPPASSTAPQTAPPPPAPQTAPTTTPAPQTAPVTPLPGQAQPIRPGQTGTPAQTGAPGQANTPGVPGTPAPGQRTPVALRTQDTPTPPAIVIPLPPTSTPDVPVRPITAEEAARIALRVQPNITIARDAILSQQGRTEQLRSGLLPQVSVLGSYTHIVTLSTQGGASGPVSTGTGTGTTGASGTGSTGTGTTGTSGTGTTGTGGTGTIGSTSGGSNSGGTTPGTSSGGTTGGSTGTGTTGSGSATGTNTGTTTTTGGASTVTQLGASSVASGDGLVGQATLRQLIFDFNHTLDLVRQSQALERAAAQGLTRVQFDLVLQVKQAYYQLAQNAQLVEVNEANLANRQSQLELATARLNSGLGQPQDVVTAQTAKAEAVQALNVARNLEGIARQNLALYIGIDPRTPLQTSDAGEPPFASDDVNALVTTALARRPEILQAQEQIRSARYGVNSARSTNAPVVSGDLNLTTRGTDFPTEDNTFSVGASVQFTPFDGGLTRGLVKQARATLDSYQAQLALAQLNVATDVTQAYLNLRTAEQRIGAALSEVNNAEEGVRIATGRYRAGLGQFLDIINAQAFLLSARTNLVTTQALVEQNRAALNRAIAAPVTR